jgi:hypothetical protein
MQVLLLWCALAGLASTEVCRVHPATPASAQERMEQLLHESEGPGQIDVRHVAENAWHWWIQDQSSQMTYQRVHGGIGP